MLNIPIVDNPKMADAAFGELQIELKKHLSFLTVCYGVVKTIEREGQKLPVVYSGDNEYITVMPGGSVSGYSFFDIAPKQDFARWLKNSAPVVKYNFGLVVWYNLSSIPDSDKEKIKAEISQTLWQKVILRHSTYKISSMSDDAQEIFSKFYAQGMNNKYLLHPYGAVRFNGELYFSEKGNLE